MNITQIKQTKTLPFHNLYIGVHNVLEIYLNENEPAGKSLEKLFNRNRAWGKRDRKFVAEIFYETIRWKNRIFFLLDEILTKENIWKYIATLLLLKGNELPDFEEFKNLNLEKVVSSLHKKPSLQAGISYQNWMITHLINKKGRDVIQDLDAMNNEAPLCIRVNLIKTSHSDLKSELEKTYENIICYEDVPDAMVFPNKPKLKTSKWYKEGLFEIQDKSSQEAAIFLNVRPNQKVIDACAGAGGKTLHIASLLNNSGEIVALDTRKKALSELRKRYERNGVTNIKIEQIRYNTAERYTGFADRLLIDAPCSGTGTIRRQPELKWSINKKQLNEYVKLQKKLLNRYSVMLKSGGMMVYATCSIFPDENEEQVKTFCIENRNFELIKEKTINPRDGFDGFYMAMLKKS